jgi:hypothetical protein
MAIIDVPIDVPELAPPVGLVVLELALVASTIRPNLDTHAFAVSTSPLAIVNDATLTQCI